MEPTPDGTVDALGTTQPPRRFGLLPADKRQALRIRRYLMAAATSLLIIVFLFLAAGLGIVPMEVAIRGSGAVAALAVLFYVLLRSGINLRFRDPSLTTEQIGSAIVVLAFIMYYVPQSRGALIILYLVPLMFGVLKLDTLRMLALAMLTLAAHSLVTWLSFRATPAFDLQDGLVQLAVLAVVLPWFALMGGYVNRMRRRLSDTNRTLVAAVSRIEQLAIRDALTGVFNRRHLLETLEREQARAIRIGSQLSICLFDLDNFKSINDTFGHPAGDQVLKRFASLSCAGLRSVDVFGRYGGEEFLLVLPDTDVKGAAATVARIRDRMAKTPFPGVPDDHPVTVTIGLAALVAPEDIAALIARADAALYAGKGAGRNRVAVA